MSASSSAAAHAHAAARLERLDRRSFARLGPLATSSVDERARRRDRIGEAGVGLEERIGDALARNAEVGRVDLVARRTLAQLHLAVPARRLGALLVDEEEPAAARRSTAARGTPRAERTAMRTTSGFE